MALIEFDATFKGTITSLAQYIVRAKGPCAAILKNHFSAINDKTFIHMTEIFLQPEKLNESQANPTKTARKNRRKFVENRCKENIDDWKKNKQQAPFLSK